ncbi:unc-79-like 2 [Homarus americanus]|uniref:Unc-79-like 2 n=1 Tax=Homarus americanus TaxID=6706 RepID=A0A8J5MTF8_HOMAM|nr:unc-79-like 2 [Homarus americanus]
MDNSSIPFVGWKPLLCQIEECDGDGTNEAVKVCLDHAVCLGACPDSPPPLYICMDCVEDIKREHCTIDFFDILMPMAQVSATCENKNCRSTEKNAIATCFSMECASYNGNKPIRYCSQCNNIRHNNRRGTDHIVHTTIGSPWAMEPQMQNYTIEAIVSLLNEAQPLGDKTKCKDQDRLNRAGLLDDIDKSDGLSPEESRLLSRYGVWLVVGLCAPTPDTPIEMLGRIIAALCHWFNATQYIPDDQQGTAIERLKSENIHNWLQEVCKTHFEVFVSCLMPHPVEYARVGGHWDTLATRTDHIKEGFNRLFCLVPYELVTVQVWDRVMPHWMEAIHNEIPEEELPELKITLSKLLDSDMSPLGFDATQMYKFISVRFTNTSGSVQEQTLSWLQILTSLNIVIPMSLLLMIFREGVSSLCSPPAPTRKTSSSGKQDSSVLEPVVEDDSHSSSALSEDERPPSDHPEDHYSDPELNLTCFVLMLDVLFKQMEVQEVEKHQGVEGQESVAVMALVCDMLSASCLAPHTCDGEQECTTCELTTAFFQLEMDVVAYLCPRVAIQNNRVADIIPQEMESSQATKSPELSTQNAQTGSYTQSPKPCHQLPPLKEGGLMSVMANMPQIVTATVETVGELDIAPNIPQEHVVKAVARAVTLTEEDVAHATANVAKPSVVGEDDEPIDTTQHTDDDDDDFWVTSQGKFKFRIEDLPPHLQRLETFEDGDVVYHICVCLKYLVLHGEAMAHAANDHRGFLIWCQENKSIGIMWSLIEAEWSHVAEVCVSLLLHFVTLPCGSDIFWKLCENHFNHQDWKVRFQAVEKVVVIGRFLGMSAVRQCPGLQAAIAHAFCFLIASLDDINVAVAQRAYLYLTTLPDAGLRALCWCLEQQLSSRLPDRRIFTWEFFFNRFDALYLEAQIALEKYGDIAFPRDLKNSDMTSDVFERKLSRAKDALTLVQSASVRTLSGSLGTKWPYKRTMSAPANMFNRTVEKQVDKEKEKTYLRQASAPLLKRKSSKIGLGQVLGTFQSNHLVSADGGMRCSDDGSVVHQLQRAMDLEETDKDTLHLLVFLFMQFLSQPQHAGGSEDIGNLKMMTLVLRHLSVLMGYSFQERCFSISPSRLRSSPVFNAFLSNLSHVLDHNFSMGTSLLPTCLPVLQFCAAPHRVADLRYPVFSLWSLQPHPRKYWLKSVLTFLYKYKYDSQVLSTQALSLVRIVLNTLDSHHHRCRKVDDPTLCAASSAYSRGLLKFA